MNFMSKKAFFVDLTNFYSQLIKSGLDKPENLRNYFMDWFDFSSLSKAITSEVCDIWVFCSREKLGAKDSQISDKYLKDLIDRFNSQKGVTARNVNIKGEQREPYKTTCEKCGCETDAVWKSEKGIDSSLIVHLFDTMESWDVAYLISGDADFVPAVKSLRRRGKIVNGIGFPKKTSSALVRECFEYVNLEFDFIINDYFCYLFTKDKGLFWKYLTDIQPISKKEPEDIEVRICRVENIKTGELNVVLTSTRSRDLASWEKDSFVRFGFDKAGWGGEKYSKEERTQIYKFNAFFAELVKNKLIYQLSKADFGSWKTYYRYPKDDEQVEESELIFRWDTKEKKINLFIVPRLKQNNKVCGFIFTYACERFLSRQS